jgi:hypothetical protein
MFKFIIFSGEMEAVNQAQAANGSTDELEELRSGMGIFKRRHKHKIQHNLKKEN